MLSTGRIDLIVKTTHHIYIIELKLRNNGGKEAAIKQILDRQYMEPFKADKREVVGLGIDSQSILLSQAPYTTDIQSF